MIVSHAELELILNPRIRQRTFRLPVRRGEWGELKRCPARKGGVYTLRASVPYQRLRAEAGLLGSQRAGVLWLIDQCSMPAASVVITVRDVELVGDWWLVRFSKGDQTDGLDTPRLLAARPSARSGDYTSVAALALPGSSEEVPARDHERFAVDGELRHADFLSEHRRRLLRAVETVRVQSALRGGPPRAQKRLKSVEHHLRALDRESRDVA